MAKKTPAAPENAQDSAQKQPEAAIAPQAESAPQAGSTLPFAQKRDELIKKFRANAVPREADYKQLLDQHYDVAGALGMANRDDNNGGTTGNGLVFENDKLHVKAKATGGLVSDTNGVSLVAGPSLTIGSDNKVNVKISGTNGLKISADGEVAINVYSNNIESEGEAAAVIINQKNNVGLWVNVGAAGDKKGLKQYKSTSSLGSVLGVSHDDTLQINSTTGKLGIKPINIPVQSASAPLLLSGKNLTLSVNSTLSTTGGTLGVNSTAFPVTSASAPLLLSGKNLTLSVNSTLSTTGGTLGVNSAAFPVTSASAPLLLSGKNLTLRVNSTLSTTGGTLGVNPAPSGGLTSNTNGLMVQPQVNGGLVLSSSGLRVNIDSTTIKLDSSGALYTPAESKNKLVNNYAKLLDCHLYAFNDLYLVFIHTTTHDSNFKVIGIGARTNMNEEINYKVFLAGKEIQRDMFSAAAGQCAFTVNARFSAGEVIAIGYNDEYKMTIQSVQ